MIKITIKAKMITNLSSVHPNGGLCTSLAHKLSVHSESKLFNAHSAAAAAAAVETLYWREKATLAISALAQNLKFVYNTHKNKLFDFSKIIISRLIC